MADTSALAKRMKNNYEGRTKYKLLRRTPTIIRLDGKCFHTYTKGLNRPFDEGLMEDMIETTRFLCQNIEGTKCGYTQSDEISLLISDFDRLETQAWFDYNVQKMASVAASMATAKFNELRTRRRLLEQTEEFYKEYNADLDSVKTKGRKDKSRTIQRFFKELNMVTPAFFDARVFQIPEYEEVVNYFLWRQRDATTNSISMLAQSLYSHKELFKKNTSEMQEMCWEKGQNWNDLNYSKKRGSFIVQNLLVKNQILSYGERNQWASPSVLSGATKVGDLWYQRDIKSSYYKNKKGRLLEWNKVEGQPFEDWVDVPFDKVRSKWDKVKTPMFGKERDSILKLFK